MHDFSDSASTLCSSDSANQYTDRMMAQSILLLEYNGLPKVKVTVASNISLAKLKELAAEKFSISCQPVTLEYVDKDFDEWVAVDDTYQLPNKGKLRVSIVSSFPYIMYFTSNSLGESHSLLQLELN